MKKLVLQKLSDSDYIYSGVYMIVFPNNKKYIGISNNMRRRMNEHNIDFRNNLPIEHAIQKYGKITDFILLEEIDVNDRELMRQREKYWIAKYHSNDRKFGYNVSEGGDGADMGSNNSQAKFTEEQIQQIYQDLKDNKETMIDIATKYQINLSSLSCINNGKTYFHSNEVYPIRYGFVKIKKGIENYNSKFDEATLNQIFKLLKENDLTMKDITKQFHVAESTIQNINRGTTYIKENEQYPLRKSKTGAKKLTQEQVLDIIYRLKNEPEKSMNQIGRDLNIPSKTISSINCGIIYKQKNESYPIRKRQ